MYMHHLQQKSGLKSVENFNRFGIFLTALVCASIMCVCIYKKNKHVKIEFVVQVLLMASTLCCKLQPMLDRAISIIKGHTRLFFLQFVMLIIGMKNS